MNALAALSRLPIFSTVSPAEAEKLATRLQPRYFVAGQTIFQRGDSDANLYFIESGEVKIRLMSPEGKERILATAGPGSSFGMASLLNGGPRSVDAVAKADCSTLNLERDAFLDFLRVNPETAIAVLSTFGGMIREADEMIYLVTFVDVPGRVAQTLLKLSTSKNLGEKETFAVNESELAASVGASRETISRCLSSLQRQGIIQFQHGQLRILMPHELRSGLS